MIHQIILIAPLIAAGIIAAGAAIGGIQQNRAAKKAQERANDQNIEFWNLQNSYNNPQQQMIRLQKAGLNPNLIYGTPSGAAVGNADKIAPSKAAPKTNIGEKAGMNFMAGQQIKATTDNLQAQNDVILQKKILKEEQIKNTKAITLDKNLENALKAGTMSEQLQARQQAGKQAMANLDNTTASTDLTLAKTETENQSRAPQISLLHQKLKEAKANTARLVTEQQFRAEALKFRKVGIEMTDNKAFRMGGQILSNQTTMSNLKKALSPPKGQTTWKQYYESLSNFLINLTK